LAASDRWAVAEDEAEDEEACSPLAWRDAFLGVIGVETRARRKRTVLEGAGEWSFPDG
jgi:hypothetical protein